MQQLEHIGSICDLHFWDLLLPFFPIQESLHMIHFYLNLFYEDYNAIKQNFQK